jgi:hypothetical protein
MNNRLLLALPLALALATPAHAQRLDAHAVDYGGVLIPVAQAKPPAGSELIAFRPRCHDQMVSEVQPNGQVFWGVPTPDGRMGWLHSLPHMPKEDALTELSEMGICKSGTEADGTVAVPIVFTSDLPQTSVAMPTATPGSRQVPDTPTGGSSPLALIAGGVAMAAIAGFGMALLNRQKKEEPTATAHPDYVDPFEEI